MQTQNQNIKYFCFARASTGKIIITWSTSHQEDLFNQAQKVGSSDQIVNQIGNMQIQAEQREKINTTHGSWYIKKDGRDILYAICVNPKYSERHSYTIIKNIQNQLEELGNYQYLPNEKLKEKTKNQIPRLIEKYQNINKVDKLSKANHQVQDIKMNLGVNIQRIINNQASLEGVSEKADEMKLNAQQFKENSQQLQSIMYWRNMKLNIIIGLVIVAIVGFVVFGLVQAFSKKQQ